LIFAYETRHSLVSQACEQNNGDFVRYLLDQGFEYKKHDTVSIIFTEWSLFFFHIFPIHAGAGSVEILQLLMRKGIDLSLLDLKHHVFLLFTEDTTILCS
jgi:hypothetical protein